MIRKAFDLQPIMQTKIITRELLEHGIQSPQAIVEEVLDGLKVSLSAYVLAEKLEPRTFRHSIDRFFNVPETWWDHFKDQYKDRWWMPFKKIKYKRLEVNEELVVEVQPMYIFPKADPIDIHKSFGPPSKMVTYIEDLHSSCEC